MNTVDIIKGALDDMTRSERQVASFYLSHPNDFAFCTLDAIAAKIDTSTTSVLRFCRRVGFQGYKDLQQAARQQISFQPQLPDKFQRSLDSADDLLMRTIGRDVQCLHDTFQNINQVALSTAVKALADGKRIYTFGMRESYSLAHYAYTRLLSVRSGVYLLQAGSNGQIETLLNLEEGDVCLAFLFKRYTQQSIQLLEMLQKKHVQIILITDPFPTQVEKLADCLLSCYVDRSGIKNSSVAPVALMDYLCDAVAASLGDAALDHMHQAEALFQQGGIL